MLPAPDNSMVLGDLRPSAAARALKAGDVVDARSMQPKWAGAWIPAVILSVRNDNDLLIP